MQPNDPTPRARPALRSPAAPLGFFPPGDEPRAATVACATAPIHLDAATLLVEARFRDITLASRLMPADRPGRFWIGPAKRADAPVNPAWLADPLAGHALVEQTAAGLTLNLAPAMRAELRTPVQRLSIPPDILMETLEGFPNPPATTPPGRAQLRQRVLADRRLALPPDSHLHIACGEVTFELRAVEAPAQLPRPRLPRGWQTDLRYLLGVALALGVVLGLARLVPQDPRALSLDMFGADHRVDRMITIPLDLATPVIDRALAATHGAAGGGAQAARGLSGQTGDRSSRHTNRRLAIQGTATPANARDAAARVRTTGLLALLDGARSSPLADVMASGPVLGADARDALGQMVATTIGTDFGAGGLGPVGTGAGGGGTGDGTIGTASFGTKGRFGQGPGGDGRYGYGYGVGVGVGELHRRQSRTPEIIPGRLAVTGTLDKEIIRREVHRHLNEVRFCYDEGLVRRPGLQGRLVVHFTIAATGRVLAAVPQSSTLGMPSVESCIVQAVGRWTFPQPAGGGLALVSYPFQFSRAGE